MNDEKKIMSIFAQAYQLIAKASKQEPSQEGFQQVLELLGEEGIQECAKVADQGPEAVAQTMIQIIQDKQAQKAANGAKLRYIMQLRGKCPTGYLKNGGRCKPCEMKNGVFHNQADLLGKGGDVPNRFGKKKSEAMAKEQDGGKTPKKNTRKSNTQKNNEVFQRPTEPQSSTRVQQRPPLDLARASQVAPTYYGRYAVNKHDPRYAMKDEYVSDVNGNGYARTIMITPQGNDTMPGVTYLYPSRYNNYGVTNNANFNRIMNSVPKSARKYGKTEKVLGLGQYQY